MTTTRDIQSAKAELETSLRQTILESSSVPPTRRITENEKDPATYNSILADLEALLKQEFFPKFSSSSPASNMPQTEKSFSTGDSVLEDLEELMKQELFSQSHPHSSRQLNRNNNSHGRGVGSEAIYFYRRLETRDSIRLFQLNLL
jgi:hypothetical protein